MDIRLMESLQDRLRHKVLNDINMTQEEFREAISDPSFSIGELYTGLLQEDVDGNLREAAGSTFGQLMRLGVQVFANDYFALALDDTIYQDIVMVMPSDKRAEFYAPMYAGQLPKPVDAQDRYASSYFKGTDSMMINLKFGRLYEFEYELWEDDKTGEIRRRAAEMGQGMRITQELWFTARMMGATQTFPEDITVPPPQIVENVYDSNLYGPGVGNQPQSAGVRLMQSAIEDAAIAMGRARDPLRNRLLTRPDTLIVAIDEQFNAAKLINSTLQPSMPGNISQAAGGHTVTAGQATSGLLGGVTGFVNTINPLYGLFKLKVSKWLPNHYWFLGQAKKGLVMQTREPLSVIQENPMAGESFSRDVYVYKTRARWEMDWIEGSNYFWYRGFRP